jgi:ubiquinone biosynthesis protein UbiJ
MNLKPSLLVTIGIERILNQYLQLDSDTRPKIAALSGKVIAVEVIFTTTETTPSLTLFLLPSPKGLQVTDHHAGPADVSIRGTPLALARQLGQRTSYLSDTDVEIRGNTQLAKALAELLNGVDIDWEEHLSNLVGDAVAHQVGNAARHIQTWGKQALDTLFKNAVEYLQQETRDLPSSGSMANFIDTVDALRSDTDRLTARIHRLQQADLPQSNRRRTTQDKRAMH